MSIEDEEYTPVVLEALYEIAEIIYMQLDIEYQDVWLQRVIEKGLWRPPYDR